MHFMHAVYFVHMGAETHAVTEDPCKALTTAFQLKPIKPNHKGKTQMFIIFTYTMPFVIKFQAFLLIAFTTT